MEGEFVAKSSEEVTLKQIEDQKMFVRRYVAFQLSKDQVSPDSQALVPYDAELPQTPEIQNLVEEMESALYSITFGSIETFKKVKYQAFSAAIQNQNHVDLCLSYLKQRKQTSQAKTQIFAYRVSQNNLEIQIDNQDQFVEEGYEDGTEEGCGQKLLTQLQKMGVENILIVVYMWHQRMVGTSPSTEVYKCVLERAKELLTTLHQKVLQAEVQINKKISIQKENEKILAITGPTEKLGKGAAGIYDNRNRLQKSKQIIGQDLTTKVYPTDVIPEKNIQGRKFEYRPNNFMASKVDYQQSKQSEKNQLSEYDNKNQYSMMPDALHGSGFAHSPDRNGDSEGDELEIELTEEEFHYAVEMTEQSIKRLTKAHLIDLKNMIKPHSLIEKVLQMVCILKGCVAPSWTLARELMASMTFKLELVLMDPTRIKPSLIRKVVKILNKYHSYLTPNNIAKINEGASILLAWVINLVKWNAGHTRYHFVHTNQQYSEEQQMGQTNMTGSKLNGGIPTEQNTLLGRWDTSQNQNQNRGYTQNNIRAIRPSETNIQSDMQESRMSSSRIRDDNFPVILEAKIRKEQNAYEDEFVGSNNNPLTEVEIQHTGQGVHQRTGSKGRQGDFIQSKEIVFQGNQQNLGSPTSKQQSRTQQKKQGISSPQRKNTGTGQNQQEQRQQSRAEQYVVHHLVADLNKNDRSKATQQLERLLQTGNLSNANEDEIVRYIEDHQHQLDDLPTELLMQLAEKLKSKRGQHLQQLQQNEKRGQSDISQNVTV